MISNRQSLPPFATALIAGQVAFGCRRAFDIELSWWLVAKYVLRFAATGGTMIPPEIVRRLVETADVVVANLPHDALVKLGLDYDSLSAINPRIITCAISGFGETGPLPNRPAFDLVAQGMGGGMSLTGHADGEPLRAGIPIGDLAGGMFGTIGILAAVEARHTTGRGQHIDISMFDAQLSLLNYMGTMYLMSGISPGRSGNGHFVHVPYDTFRTTTRHLIVAVIADSGWANLVALLGDEALNNPLFADQRGRFANKAFIVERVQAAFEKESCEHWLEVLAKAKVPAAPVNELSHAFADPQALARQMRVRVPLSTALGLSCRRTRLKSVPFNCPDAATVCVNPRSQACRTLWTTCCRRCVASWTARLPSSVTAWAPWWPTSAPEGSVPKGRLNRCT